MLYDFNYDIYLADEICILSPRGNNPITVKNLKRYQALESADFNIVKCNSADQICLIQITAILCSWMNVS